MGRRDKKKQSGNGRDQERLARPSQLRKRYQALDVLVQRFDDALKQQRGGSGPLVPFPGFVTRLTWSGMPSHVGENDPLGLLAFEQRLELYQSREHLQFLVEGQLVYSLSFEKFIGKYPLERSDKQKADLMLVYEVRLLLGAGAGTAAERAYQGQSQKGEGLAFEGDHRERTIHLLIYMRYVRGPEKQILEKQGIGGLNWTMFCIPFAAKVPEGEAVPSLEFYNDDNNLLAYRLSPLERDMIWRLAVPLYRWVLEPEHSQRYRQLCREKLGKELEEFQARADELQRPLPELEAERESLKERIANLERTLASKKEKLATFETSAALNLEQARAGVESERTNLLGLAERRLAILRQVRDRKLTPEQTAPDLATIQASENSSRKALSQAEAGLTQLQTRLTPEEQSLSALVAAAELALVEPRKQLSRVEAEIDRIEEEFDKLNAPAYRVSMLLKEHQ